MIGHCAIWEQHPISIDVRVDDATEDFTAETHTRGNDQTNVWKTPDDPRHAGSSGQTGRLSPVFSQRNKGNKLIHF